MDNSIRDKFGLTGRDFKTITDIFTKYPQVELVHIFGSRSKGNYKPGSDIDLAIMNSDVDDEIISRLKGEFDDSDLPYTVDLVNFYTLKHPDFIDHIKRVGVLFYQR